MPLTDRGTTEEGVMTEFVRVETGGDGVATIRLDRPKMNALNRQLQRELGACARQVDADPHVRAVVIYGGERSFAAGVDIKEMADMTYADMSAQSREMQSCFTAVASIGKPVVAAVTGYALGGGCELALCARYPHRGGERPSWASRRSCSA